MNPFKHVFSLLFVIFGGGCLILSNFVIHNDYYQRHLNQSSLANDNILAAMQVKPDIKGYYRLKDTVEESTYESSSQADPIFFIDNDDQLAVLIVDNEVFYYDQNNQLVKYNANDDDYTSHDQTRFSPTILKRAQAHRLAFLEAYKHREITPWLNLQWLYNTLHIKHYT
ncbi:hypothetical protein [Vaginisenegalia massiliensis]|uniref:hypothetical protein n=1 Tax=Vaginisenegalia massiliensis TaxID=2058294 RepID=UPI000F543743|nr:hypothetical protein [Vaginisenegalia massiliensis]